MAAAPLSGASYDFFLAPIPAVVRKFLWSNRTAFSWIGAVSSACWSFVFWAENGRPVSAELVLATVETTVFWWSLYCALAGFFFASTLFYLRQQNLLREIEALQKERSNHQAAHASLTADYSRFQKIASHVLVPFPLDQLVQKTDVMPEQLASHAYEPRKLLANRHSSGQ